MNLNNKINPIDIGISKLKGRSKASLVCGLFFLLIFSCKSEGNGNGNGDATKHTLTITKPTDGTLSSDVGSIKCGSKGTTCKAEFSKGTKVTLTATADTGYAPAAWQGNCDKTAPDQACKLVMDANKSAGLTFIDPNDIDGDGIPNDTDVDEDNDGLIEVHNLDMFDHIRHSLAGTSYKTGADAKGNTRGAPTGQTDNCKTATDGAYLCGYELKSIGARPSMSAKGNCYDNAVAESFFATLKREEVNRKEYKNIREARISLFDYIEVFYNRQRLHSALNYKTPAEVAA